jgi:hypothetical protein
MYLIIDTAKIPKIPSTAHTRLALELARILAAELISTVEDLPKLKYSIEDYKYFIVVGSAFYPEIALLEARLRKNRNAIIVWVNNEYSCSPNSEYSKMIKQRESIVISNVVEESNRVKGYSKFFLCNLNCLLFDMLERPSDQKKYGLIYYGTYRPGRRLYLQKYFQDRNFILSSSKKNLRKFKYSCGCSAIWCDKLNWEKGRESLNLFRYSLYLEDEYTHNHYNHLANRFYEALMCNCVQFFDVTCSNTLWLSGYDVKEDFIVRDATELTKKIEEFNFNERLKEQISWKKRATLEKLQTIQKLKEILCQQ